MRYLTLKDIGELLDKDTYKTIVDNFGADDDEFIDDIAASLESNPNAFEGYRFGSNQVDPVTSELIYRRGAPMTKEALDKILKAGIVKTYATKPKRDEDGNIIEPADDNRPIDEFYDDLHLEQARNSGHELDEAEDPFKDLKTVYTTSDDTGLVWKDPVAFKKFVIGSLLAGVPKEDREEDLKYYWKFTPEELIKHHDTAGGVTSFDATATDDSGAKIFDPYDKNLTWDASLRDLYNTGDDYDPFDNDLYDLLDNFNGDIEDVNGDGDPDVMTEDTDGDGEADTATVTADSEDEAAEGVAEAEDSIDDKVEQDSTGSLNDKPSEDVSDEKLKDKKSSGCVSDEKVKDKKHPDSCSCAECTKKKEQELSDSRFKNIVNTLVDKLW